MILEISKSVVLITGRNTKHFGSGFVVHHDNEGSYVITCAHVIADVGDVDGINGIIVNHRPDLPVRLIASGVTMGVDLAVLLVQGLADKPVLQLTLGGVQNLPVTISGYRRHPEQTHLLRDLRGVLSGEVGIHAQGQPNPTPAWDLRIEDNGQLADGYSGAPVVDAATGLVVAVASHSERSGIWGQGISTAALKKWSNLPEEVFMQPLTDGVAVFRGKKQQSSGSISQVIEPVERSLSALGRLTNDSGVRTRVAIYSEQFQQFSAQIDRLRLYKEVHDQLHQLYLHTYIGLKVDINRISSGRSSLEEPLTEEQMLAYAWSAHQISKDLQMVSKQGAIPNYQLNWVDDLVKISNDLLHGVEHHDFEKVKYVFRKLRRILSIYPSIFNQKLVEAAEGLIQIQVSSMMVNIKDQLVTLPVDSVLRVTFENGVTAIADISMQLQALIQEHNTWQTIDRILQTVEVVLSEDPIELEEQWESIVKSVTTLCVERQDNWVREIYLHMDRLEDALKGKEYTKIEARYTGFRRAVSLRFYHIDRTIKDFCTQLARLGQPLNALQQRLALGT